MSPAPTTTLALTGRGARARARASTRRGSAHARAQVPLSKTARHVSAEEWHRRLSLRSNKPSAQLASGSGVHAADTVVLDVRNVYESRIGRFEVSGVETLCPPIRQFSELPQWLESVRHVRPFSRPATPDPPAGARSPAAAYARVRTARRCSVSRARR